MNNSNCTDTIRNDTHLHVASLSWRQWVIEGKRLAVNEALKTANLLTLWQKRCSQRRAMTEMDDRMADDIGLNRQEILQEASKPFWKA
ncbi:MAG: DUF1127 domain-containing protein [Rhodospirillaceae bacterium]|nr:DUF1127 domain-containing protein [Rhodospirillaceae bacterium]